MCLELRYVPDCIAGEFAREQSRILGFDACTYLNGSLLMLERRNPLTSQILRRLSRARMLGSRISCIEDSLASCVSLWGLAAVPYKASEIGDCLLPLWPASRRCLADALLLTQQQCSFILTSLPLLASYVLRAKGPLPAHQYIQLSRRCSAATFCSPARLGSTRTAQRDQLLGAKQHAGLPNSVAALTPS